MPPKAARSGWIQCHPLQRIHLSWQACNGSPITSRCHVRSCLHHGQPGAGPRSERQPPQQALGRGHSSPTRQHASKTPRKAPHIGPIAPAAARAPACEPCAVRRTPAPGLDPHHRARGSAPGACGSPSAICTSLPCVNRDTWSAKPMSAPEVHVGRRAPRAWEDRRAARQLRLDLETAWLVLEAARVLGSAAPGGDQLQLEPSTAVRVANERPCTAAPGDAPRASASRHLRLRRPSARQRTHTRAPCTRAQCTILPNRRT